MQKTPPPISELKKACLKSDERFHQCSLGAAGAQKALHQMSTELRVGSEYLVQGMQFVGEVIHDAQTFNSEQRKMDSLKECVQNGMTLKSCEKKFPLPSIVDEYKSLQRLFPSTETSPQELGKKR